MITIKSENEIKIMRQGAKILARIIKKVGQAVSPGIRTKELDVFAESLILKSGNKPAFKGYDRFPNSLCTSINQEIVHGIPSDRILKQGDIISLDLGLIYKGFYTDMAITVPVGDISPEAHRLIRITKKVLKIAIKKSRQGNTFGDVGNLIQRYAKSQGYNVVKELCGHGIGRDLHEDPQILNYGNRKTGETIKKGMVFCLEPMLTPGDWHIKKAKDGYAYTTFDNSLSAHFEHMIAITKNGPETLTIIP